MSLLAQAVTWCDVTQAVASVVIALSSIVAICVAVKHWRDDDPHSDDCPAAEAKRLATVSKLDGVLNNRIGHAPGYK